MCAVSEALAVFSVSCSALFLRECVSERSAAVEEKEEEEPERRRRRRWLHVGTYGAGVLSVVVSVVAGEAWLMLRVSALAVCAIFGVEWLGKRVRALRRRLNFVEAESAAAKSAALQQADEVARAKADVTAIKAQATAQQSEYFRLLEHLGRLTQQNDATAPRAKGDKQKQS